MNIRPKLHRKIRRAWNLSMVASTILITLLTPALRGAQEPQRRFGIVPVKGSQRALALTARHLNYYGGRVISAVKVVMVRYGTGTYLGNIAGTTKPTMEMFYRQVVDNPYLDWLCEYQTN